MPIAQHASTCPAHVLKPWDMGRGPRGALDLARGRAPAAGALGAYQKQMTQWLFVGLRLARADLPSFLFFPTNGKCGRVGERGEERKKVMGAPMEGCDGEVLAAKQEGLAGVVKKECLLELCVQCPASVLRTLLDCMVAGASAATLGHLAEVGPRTACACLCAATRRSCTCL